VPVAMVDDTGASPVTYYIHTDQLGTPQKMTDGSANIVWDNLSDPFGNAAATQGTNWGAANWGDFDWAMTMLSLSNLRFPGQYFDGETGLHQNWNRDYDPTIGRYAQSDPIGVIGGINLYEYAEGNPLGYFDSTGLNPAVGAVVGAEIGTAIIPGPGTIAGAILGTTAGLGIGIAVDLALESRSRASGEERLPIVNPGRDCNGNCNPCPPGKRWYVARPGHGHQRGYWHEIKYNQDSRTCICYPDRPSTNLKGE
jgi:RHS repeat-associated protein